MANKELRIMIADTSLAKLIAIEKSLNKLGYYRILPMYSCEEIRKLTNSLAITFDVLIAHRALAMNTEDDLMFFCQATHKINHAFLYESQPSELAMTSMASVKTLITCTTNTPSEALIAGFMNSIDPPSPWECLKNLSWIQGVARPDRKLFHPGDSNTQTFSKKPD